MYLATGRLPTYGGIEIRLDGSSVTTALRGDLLSACREYFVTSPKAHCRNPYGDQVKRAQIRPSMAALLVVFASQLYHIPKDPMPLFYLLKFANKYEPLRKLKWPTLEIFERLMNGLMRLNDDYLKFSIVSTISRAFSHMENQGVEKARSLLP